MQDKETMVALRLIANVSVRTDPPSLSEQNGDYRITHPFPVHAEGKLIKIRTF